MRLTATTAILGILTFPIVGITSADDNVDSIVKKLAGVWDVEEGVNRGVPIPEDELEGTTMKVDKHTIITYDRDANEKYRSTYTLDTNVSPIAIDMTTEMKGMPPMKSLGIIQFDGDDEFHLCYALPGADRPKTFESTEGSKTMLFELEKED